MAASRHAVVVLCAAFAACGASLPQSAGWLDPKTGIRIVVDAVDAHPSLRDHGRTLCVVSPGGAVQRFALHPENGLGVPCNLYRLDAQRLLVVDCDGVWITIGAGGEVESRRWCWRRELPREFLGCFRAERDRVYRLEQGAAPEIYLFKDAPDGVERDG
ncbi:MAG: hypothetical protein H6835_07650 [Planctomycetes bacterium]|nr:hypothetical protein [Planctomycetota bacterium]